MAGAFCAATIQADSTWVYAVQISANVQTSPAAIVLSWQPDPYGANSYQVHRKTKGSGGWSHLATLPGSASTYVDYAVGVGSAFEYQVVKAGALGYTGFGYIYAGLQAPFAERRGKVILVVDSTMAGPLSAELNRLRNDLVGDGWTVVRRDVGRGDNPANVRNLIISEYNADPGNVNTVFLFGHVPIYRSGNLNVDGHQPRRMPADAVYGDVDGGWGDNSYLPSDVDLMVGRVDLWNMPVAGNEVELLRNYLNKDHRWRHKIVSVPQRAIVGNRFGDINGEAFAASGFRNADPFVGHNGIDIADEKDGAPADRRWSTMLSRNSYLWAYGCGGGSYVSMSGMGVHGTYGDVVSADIVGGDAKAVFFMMMGSWLGEWDSTDNIMRAALATPSLGLTCSWAGRPHWYYHHMALGETIGYSARLSMNNGGLYRNQVNQFARGVHIALMGDPTLRAHPVAPPSNLTGGGGAGNVRLTWSASADSELGYHIYRAGNIAGQFARVNGSLVNGTAFTDTTAAAGSTYVYMVRAIKLENTPSGSYLNGSQGVFETVTVGGVQPPDPPDPEPDRAPPSVVITAPAPKAIVSGANVLLSANASDNVRVAGVQFRVDGVNVGSEIWVSPYQFRWDSTKASAGTHSITAIARDAAGNRATAAAVAVTVSKGVAFTDIVWMEDNLPTGAQPSAQRDRWQWTTTRKVGGTRAHQSVLAEGMHQHFFDNATAGLNVGTGDYLYTWVYLDPKQLPREIMLQWNDGSWEHRAYWGQNLIHYGTLGTAGRRYMGPLPPAGQWFRLKVPAAWLGLEGRRIKGMSFTLHGGMAYWDRAGKLVRK